MNGVLVQSVSAEKGATEHGVTINLTHITAGFLLVSRQAAIAARELYENAKQLLRENRTALGQEVVPARAFATLVRDNLKPTLGSDYSEIWDRTGFVGSLAVPYTSDEVMMLMQSLAGFFTANPALEFAARNITAAQASALYIALETATGVVITQETVVGNLLADRDAKFETLRKALRDLINELSALIEPLDQRWKSFGFNLPGAEETPDVPINLHATVSGASASLKWPTTPRANYYHVWKRVIGADHELVAVGNPSDPDFTFNDLPPNAQVELAISAVNTGGESAQSEIVTITTH